MYRLSLFLAIDEDITRQHYPDCFLLILAQYLQLLGPKKFAITDMTCKARFCALGEEEVCRCLEVFRYCFLEREICVRHHP